MIIEITPDKQKAEALIKMANVTLKRLKTINEENYPSNTLVDYYDTIHKLLEAITLQTGIKIRGEGGHQELIDYVAKKHKLNEQTRQFLQQLRDYRNRISYEGFMITKNFIHTNKQSIKYIINKLFEETNKQTKSSRNQMNQKKF
ncbi:MAG: HEPN domain-containing protein [Nanoarchaeota archaeon]